MANYNFYNKHEPVNLTITAGSFEEAEELLFEIVKSNRGWVFDQSNEDDEYDEDEESVE